MKYINLIVALTVNRAKVRIPVIQLLGKDNLLVSELWMSPLLRMLVDMKKGGILDVGVNIGQTLIKIKSLYPDIHYIGFEPNPSCVFYVNQLIRANGYRHCTLYPVGIAAKTELLQLHFFTEDSTDAAASIIPNFRNEHKIYHKEIIPCFSVLDVDLFDIGPVSIVKIDVEGAELEVISGLRGILETHRPFILIEVLPVYDPPIQERLERQKKMEEMLGDLKYKIFRIIKRGKESVEKLELVQSFGIHDKIEWSDYILCPVE